MTALQDGQALLRDGKPDEALSVLLRAEALAPADPLVQQALAEVYRACGRTSDATAADCAALALQAGSALVLYNLATVYFMAYQYPEAEKWYRRALALDPELVVANQNLAAILEMDGRQAEAHEFRDRALRRQCLFVEPASETPHRRVLILAASAFGNVPIDALLPQRTTTRIKWFIEYATDLGEDLPPYDIVFNAIGDADLAGPTAAHLSRFLARCRRPLLNRPDAVAHTHRHLTPRRLAGIPAVVVPPVLRWEGGEDGFVEAMAAAGIAWPILLRPLGSHGGHGLVRLAGPQELAPQHLAAGESCYVTAYHDTRSADGYYRKYRMIFIDRQPYAYHLAISPNWLVHYGSAEMLAEPWKRDEEQRFLEDPGAVLGADALAAVAAIGHRLDLDFCGIDFGLLADGRVLVFEANATMNVHLNDRVEDFPYKHIHVPKIFLAFDAMLERRCVGGSGD
jgi:tetratricopeptide (TPR) repeat protein